MLVAYTCLCPNVLLVWARVCGCTCCWLALIFLLSLLLVSERRCWDVHVHDVHACVQWSVVAGVACHAVCPPYIFTCRFQPHVSPKKTGTRKENKRSKVEGVYDAWISLHPSWSQSVWRREERIPFKGNSHLQQGGSTADVRASVIICSDSQSAV